MPEAEWYPDAAATARHDRTTRHSVHRAAAAASRRTAAHGAVRSRRGCGRAAAGSGRLAGTARVRYGRPIHQHARRLDRTRCGECLGPRRGAFTTTRHQRHRRHHPHQPRTRATGCARDRAAPDARCRLQQPRVRSGDRVARLACDTCRGPPVPRNGRRSSGRGEQLRGGDAAGAGDHRARPRGAGIASRTDRDRRRLPRAGCDDAVGREASRSGHDEPDATERLRTGDRRPHRGHPARPSIQLPHRGVRRAHTALRPRGAGPPVRAAAHRRPRQRSCGSGSARSTGHRAARSAGARGGRGRGVLQRRQAARWTPGGHHRRPAPLDRSGPWPPAHARVARGQAHVRRARGDARRARDGPCGRHDPGSADGGTRGRRDRRPRRTHGGGAPLGGLVRRGRGWDVHRGWRQRPWHGIADAAAGDFPGSA